MRTVEIEAIKVGTVTEAEYRTQSGELLVNAGVVVTEKHIDAMRRRNIFQVVMREKEDELQAILSKEYSLSQLDLQDNFSAVTETEPPPKALELPEFKHIKKGEEGLKQLSQSKRATAIDDAMSKGVLPDKPVGPALAKMATELAPAQRSQEYKQGVSATYDQAITDVQYILKTLANGSTVDGSHIRSIVSKFVKIFVTDKNILLNISSIKPASQNYLYHHTLNVCLIALNIAASSEYSEEQVVEIGMAALLHDVGMMLVPEEIRNKPGKITSDEWFEIQKHPILGLHLLEGVSRLPTSIPIVAYQCHERDNGKGYPKQRAGRLIHSFAKIVQIADVFEALSSPRNYRSAYIPYKAMETAIKMTRQGMLSGEFIRSLLLYASLFPVGSVVELSDKTLGKVIKANGTSFAKPVVSVLVDAQGKNLTTDKIYQQDLKANEALQIVRAHGAEHIKSVSVMDGF